MLLVQYWHVTRLILSILHFSMLLLVITVRLVLLEAGSELSQKKGMQHAGGFGFIVQQVGLAM